MPGWQITGFRWPASACSDVAQFDVYRNGFGEGLLLDCQSDLLSHLNTRLVAPLLPPDRMPQPLPRLNPLFDVDGETYMMVAQFAGAVELRELGKPVASLAEHDHAITGALDILLTGV